MSVNRLIIQTILVVFILFMCLLGLHDMDTGQNLRYLEAKGYELHEVTLGGGIMDGKQAYKQGALTVLSGLSLLVLLPLTHINWRE